MKNVVTFPSKTFPQKYPGAEEDAIPQEYDLNIVEYKKDEIEKISVGLCHLFLKKHYGSPHECEGSLIRTIGGKPVYHAENRPEAKVSFRRIGEDKIRFLNISKENEERYTSGELTLDIGLLNWKYFIILPSKEIISIESIENHSLLKIGLVNCKDKPDNQVVKKFIVSFLNDINKDAKNLINPKKIIKKEKASIYYLWNGYLSNYYCGKKMLDVSEIAENDLRRELHRYNTDKVLNDPKAIEHTEEYVLCCGMYYSTAISFFFMAFEGFLNIVLYSFIKKDLRDIDFEKRFDIEQKIKLMPSLCEGFIHDIIYMPDELCEDLKKLKSYRNEVFHSKAGGNRLKSILTYQDGFLYTYNIDQFEDYFLPSHKIQLGVDEVVKVKIIIDDIIQKIIDNMDDSIKIPTENFILKKSTIPFVYSDGKVLVGTHHWTHEI